MKRNFLDCYVSGTAWWVCLQREHNTELGFEVGLTLADQVLYLSHSASPEENKFLCCKYQEYIDTSL
jgi:hypothetical protein